MQFQIIIIIPIWYKIKAIGQNKLPSLAAIKTKEKNKFVYLGKTVYYNRYRIIKKVQKN